MPDWPAIRRITLIHDRVPEQWEATLNPIAPDQKTFHFTVTASVSGDEGSGDSAHDFQAKSGLLRLDTEDWMIEPAFEESKRPISAPLTVKWSVINQCNGQPEVIDLGNGSKQYRYVLGTGLANRSHTVELHSPAINLADVQEYRAYKPPLK